MICDSLEDVFNFKILLTVKFLSAKIHLMITLASPKKAKKSQSVLERRLPLKQDC